jgi:hypothetical protein
LCKQELLFLQDKFQSNLIEKLEKYVKQPFIITTHQYAVKQILDDIKNGLVTINPNKSPDDPNALYIFKQAPELDDDLTKDHEKYITGVMYNNMPVLSNNIQPKSKKNQRGRAQIRQIAFGKWS